MTKIKILFVHHGGAKGGAPRSILFLLKKLDLNKYEPYMVVSYDYEVLRDMYESIGVKVIYEPRIGAWHGSTVGKMSLGMLYSNVRLAMPTYIYAKRIVKEIQPDIIHLNSTCLFIFAKATKDYKKDIPIVCHVREPLLPGFWGNIIRKGCQKYVDAFVAIEQYDLESVDTQNKIAKVVYNFVDFDIYNTAVKSTVLREELGLTDKDVVALYLARISPENGVLEFIQTCKTWLKKNRSVHLCVVGKIPGKSLYQDKVVETAQGIDNIHILPFRSDVVNTIASSDFMVSPFQQPHFARSVIEGAAMGIPTIGTNVGGLRELIQDESTGLLYDYTNPSDCVAKFMKMATDEDFRRNCGIKAEILARELFDSKKNAKATFEIYDQLFRRKDSIK